MRCAIHAVAVRTNPQHGFLVWIIIFVVIRYRHKKGVVVVVGQVNFKREVLTSCCVLGEIYLPDMGLRSFENINAPPMLFGNIRYMFDDVCLYIAFKVSI